MADKDDNGFIIKVLTQMMCTDETMSKIKTRMDFGFKKYGHGLRIKDDTRQFGTSDDSWGEMLLEELYDGLNYSAAAYARTQNPEYLHIVSHIEQLCKKIRELISKEKRGIK